MNHIRQIKQRYHRYLIEKATSATNVELFMMGQDPKQISQEDYDCLVGDHVFRLSARHRLILGMLVAFLFGLWL